MLISVARAALEVRFCIFNTALNRGHRETFYVIQERTVFLIIPSIEFGSQR